MSCEPLILIARWTHSGEISLISSKCELSTYAGRLWSARTLPLPLPHAPALPWTPRGWPAWWSGRGRRLPAHAAAPSPAQTCREDHRRHGRGYGRAGMGYKLTGRRRWQLMINQWLGYSKIITTTDFEKFNLIDKKICLKLATVDIYIRMLHVTERGTNCFEDSERNKCAILCDN